MGFRYICDIVFVFLYRPRDDVFVFYLRFWGGAYVLVVQSWAWGGTRATREKKDIKMQKPSVGCVEIVPEYHGLKLLFDGSK